MLLLAKQWGLKMDSDLVMETHWWSGLNKKLQITVQVT